MSRALLLVAHGSARDANGRTSILDHAARIRAMGRFAEVGVGFWKEAPFLPDAIGQFRILVGVLGQRLRRNALVLAAVHLSGHAHDHDDADGARFN